MYWMSAGCIDAVTCTGDCLDAVKCTGDCIDAVTSTGDCVKFVFCKASSLQEMYPHYGLSEGCCFID